MLETKITYNNKDYQCEYSLNLEFGTYGVLIYFKYFNEDYIGKQLIGYIDGLTIPSVFDYQGIIEFDKEIKEYFETNNIK